MLGDTTWEPLASCKDLEALDLYLEALDLYLEALDLYLELWGVAHPRDLPKRI